MHNIKPVFITGAPRSGTTLLASMIASNNQCLALPEMHYMYEILKYDLLFNNENNNNHIFNCLIADPKFIDLGIIKNVGDVENLIRNKSAKEILFHIIDEYNKKTFNKDFRYWVEHTPHNHLYFSVLLKYFPDAKFIHIVRDGRAVYRSTKETDWGEKDVVSSAKNWKSIVENNVILSRVYPDKFITVRYEDLTSTPQKTMEIICQFINIPYGNQMLLSEGVKRQSFSKYHKKIGEKANSSSQLLWVDELKKYEIQHFTAVNYNLLKLFDYEVDAYKRKGLNPLLGLLMQGVGKIKHVFSIYKSKKRFNEVYSNYPELRNVKKRIH